MSVPARRTERLLAVAYLTALGGAGAWGPYFGLYVERRGLDGTAVGAIVAVTTAARVLSAPVWAAIADRYHLGGRVLVLASFTSIACAAAALAPAVGTVGMTVLVVLFGATRGPLGPLLDALTLRRLDDSGLDARHYGRVRRWGSLGFLATVLAAGPIADRHPAGPLWLALAVWTVGAFATLGFWDTPAPAPVPIAPALRALAREPFFAPFLLAAVLHGTALTASDNFLALHLSSLGHSSSWSGAAFALGVGCEILVMTHARAVLERIAPLTLVALAMATGALRYGWTSQLEDPVLLVAVQALHGIAFGAFWIGGVEVLRERTPDSIRASAQALFTTAGYALGAVVSGAAAAWILDRGGTARLLELAAGASAAGALLVTWAARREARHPPIGER